MCAAETSVEQALQDISRDIQQLGQLGNELDNLNKNISITGNSKPKSDALNRKEKACIKLIKVTTSRFSELASHPIAEQVCKIQAERLKSDFQRTIQRFQRVQAEIKRRLLTESRPQEPPVADLLGLEGSDHPGKDDDALLQPEFGRAQQQIQTNRGDVQELGFILEQENEMQSLEEDIVNVNNIFQQLNTLVYDQRVAVDSIEDNIEHAYVDQEAGRSELVKAARRRCRARRGWCICGSVTAGIIAIIILILVLVYGPGSK
ncbi:unnamed protein product [Calicophoron daubneyi]|uniref:t-SNARE coiled-coil homology domain-containing protein n=1 Tax=Calicophoron daubneyi TaxID=300641 RepID=A0AAV2TZ14_CALDB